MRSVANLWDDQIYIWLNDGRASGLFEAGFFQSDLIRSIQMLKEVTVSVRNLGHSEF